MDFPERTFSQLRRRWFAGELLRVAAGWIAGFLLVLGAVLLWAKLFAPNARPFVPWLGLAIVPLAAVVIWRASRRLPTSRDMLAFLDSRLDAGGLLMTLAERPDPSWRGRLPAAATWRKALPAIRPYRFARIVAMPALFAVAAGFVPAREQPQPPPRLTAGTSAARELAETFELLDQSGALDQETKAAFRQEWNDLAAESEQAPFTHEKWETVDALRERLRSSVEATQQAVSQGRSAAAMLDAAATEGKPLTAERTEQLTAELREAIETLRKNGAFDEAAEGSPDTALPDELQQLVRSGEFRLPDDAAARMQTLEQLKQLLENEAQRMADARSRTGSQRSSQTGDGDPSMRMAEAALAAMIGGEGGDASGPDDASLNFGDESDEQAARFQPTLLPPGYLDRPNESMPGVTATAPAVEPVAAGKRNTILDGDRSKGTVTWNRTLRPRHREVVRAYFQDEP